MASDFSNTICSAHLTCLFARIPWVLLQAVHQPQCKHQRVPITGVKVILGAQWFNTSTLLKVCIVADDGIDLCSARQVLRLRHARPRQ